MSTSRPPAIRSGQTGAAARSAAAWAATVVAGVVVDIGGLPVLGGPAGRGALGGDDDAAGPRPGGSSRSADPAGPGEDPGGPGVLRGEDPQGRGGR
ncbi:hypothetical protein GCM10025792_30490 [Pseudonocardia tropica]